jgi:hypothetical protein
MIQWLSGITWDEWLGFAVLMAFAVGAGLLKRKLDEDYLRDEAERRNGGKETQEGEEG